VPGRLILYPIDFGNGPIDKFVILAARRDEWFRVFVISSEIAQYVKARPYLMNQQVPIDAANHGDFLHYNSTINCGKLRPLLVSDVEKYLTKNPGRVKCCINEAVRNEVLSVVAKYGVLSDLEKAAVAEYLGSAA